MITFQEAYNIVLSHFKEMATETVDIKEVQGRILAEDIYSDIDMPPFDKSAMDGYACKAEDAHGILDLVETVPAGVVPEKKILKGQCSKIMTGAVMPEGADTVIIIEESEEHDGKVKFAPRKNGFFYKCKDNICFRGEDIKNSDVVLRKGTKIKPEHIAVLATVGCVGPLVYKLPRVGIIATGSELVEPYEKADGPKIRNSNSYQLAAQIERIPAIPVYYGIAEDTEEAIGSAISKALDENDVVLISGGVSMGDFDLVPGILAKNGVELLFDKIAIKPGKPLNFGISDKAVCFGLPGNPVSTFVQFEILVKPFLHKMMGNDFKPIIISAQVGTTIKRKRTERESLIPVTVKNGKVYPIEYHGSAHINAMCSCEFILSIPRGVGEIKEKDVVNVRQI
ncbi:MAG: molybdopterin molybdotransferase MoeA [Victivallales bacterium]|nr:molybdopterin molybdotransferase MoeA [Victivallales bacterium]